MIVPLERQVTSREISEELKNRGVPQDAMFCHAFYMGTECVTLKGNALRADYVFCDAYTVSEIIAMLSKVSFLRGHEFHLIELTPDKMAENLLWCIDSGYINVRDL